eukprot:scaffold993_cov393-Prasinococcus_capsulatus_cf.AAC.8
MIETLLGSKFNALPVVDENYACCGIIERSTFGHLRRMPNAPGEPSVDADGFLLVGAAIGTRDSDKTRVKALVRQCLAPASNCYRADV